jgi:hypothetical protein
MLRDVVDVRFQRKVMFLSLRRCLTLVLACLPLWVGAGDTRVLTVSVHGGDATRVAWFSDKLAGMLGERIRMVPPGEADVQVALDAKHFRRRCRDGDTVVGVAIAPRKVRAVGDRGHRCTALFRGARPERQLRLLQLLQPGAQRVGVLLTPDSDWLRTHLLERADLREHAPLSFDFVEVARRKELAPALNRLLPRVDALLALNETGLYDSRTARLVLLTSYRQRRPVVGPGRGFVQAGSLATTYSGDTHLARSLAEWLRRLLRNGQLPEPDWPAHFSVTLNEDVAEAYDLSPRDPRELAAELRDGERR